DAAVRELPVTIVASEVGDFANRFSWYLGVNSAGSADLAIDRGRKGKAQQFTVSDEPPALSLKIDADDFSVQISSRQRERDEQHRDYSPSRPPFSLTTLESQTHQGDAENRKECINDDR